MRPRKNRVGQIIKVKTAALALISLTMQLSFIFAPLNHLMAVTPGAVYTKSPSHLAHGLVTFGIINEVSKVNHLRLRSNFLASYQGLPLSSISLKHRLSQDLLIQLKSVTDKPIGIGFGISRPEDACQAMDWDAYAVIVSSAFAKRLAGGTPTQGSKQWRSSVEI